MGVALLQSQQHIKIGAIEGGIQRARLIRSRWALERTLAVMYSLKRVMQVCWGGQVCHGEFLMLVGQALQMESA